MCGRFTRKENFALLAKALGLDSFLQLDPSYNVAPSQMVACLRTRPETHQVEYIPLQWGLVPGWAKDPKIGYRMINARAETVAEKPSFRKAFARQRCLVLADGFYEWKREGKSKQPYYIHFRDNRPFAFAGLWERWDKGGETPLESCALITTGPNELMKPIHDRMPVILDPQHYPLWLDSDEHDRAALLPLLQPFSEEDMEAYPVSTLVNNPRSNSPQCVEPLP